MNDLERWDAQCQWAENKAREMLDAAVLKAFHDMQLRGCGAIRIALIHDELTITHEELT